MLVGTVGGGLLGDIDLAIPFLARAGLLIPVFAVALATMHDVGFVGRPLRVSTFRNELRTITQASVTYGWRKPRVRLLMMVSFLQYGFLTWGFYAWQPYFLELLGRNAVWVAGVVAALISLSTILGNTLVEWFTRFCGRRTTLLLGAAAVQTAAAVGVGLAGSFWLAVALFLLVTASMGVIGPVKQAYLHQLIPSEQRATVVSFDSMMGSAGGILGQTGLGYFSQARSIGGGYVIGGLATLLALPVLGALRQLGGRADTIVGMAGRPGACAAQGLPSVAAVDTAARGALEAEV